MPRSTRARKAHQEAAKKAHISRQENSRRWLLESFAPRSGPKTYGWDQTDRGSKEPVSRRHSSGCSDGGKHPRSRKTSREEVGRKDEGGQGGSGEGGSLDEAEMEPRSLLECFAPRSCIDPNTRRAPKRYSPRNTDSTSSWGGWASEGCQSSIASDGSQEDDAKNTSNSNSSSSSEPTQNTGTKPCRQTNHHHKGEEAKAPIPKCTSPNAPENDPSHDQFATPERPSTLVTAERPRGQQQTALA